MRDNQNENIVIYSEELFVGIAQIIEKSKKKAAVFVLSEATLMCWQLGDYINTYLKTNGRTEYGAKILATLSQQLTNAFDEWFSVHSRLLNKTRKTMKNKYIAASLLSNFLTELGYEG